jgi:tRNA pseudouridine55 synthase
VSRGKASLRDGIVVLDKGAGMTSQDAVRAVMRRTACGKAGHSGTLDKFATGVLPVLCGRYTRLARFFMDGRKRYTAQIVFGALTDTLDPEGAIVAHGPLPERDALERILPAFIGEIDQAPPAYSAIHIDGKRAHELARAGAAVEPASRKIMVHSLALRDYSQGRAILEVECGPGTYVRSLARDIAAALGTVAHLGALRRNRSAGFEEAEALPLESLDPDSPSPFTFEMARRIGLGAFTLSADKVGDFIQGKSILPAAFRALSDDTHEFQAIFELEGRLLGIVRGLPGKPEYVAVLGTAP